MGQKQMRDENVLQYSTQDSNSFQPGTGIQAFIRMSSQVGACNYVYSESIAMSPIQHPHNFCCFKGITWPVLN